jgi:hypothetical protein
MSLKRLIYPKGAQEGAKMGRCIAASYLSYFIFSPSPTQRSHVWLT